MSLLRKYVRSTFLYKLKLIDLSPFRNKIFTVEEKKTVLVHED